MILVTGGTGFIGRHLVWGLVNRGYSVRIMARNLSMVKDGLPGEVELVKGDITDRPSLLKACEGVDSVIHLVAIIREDKDLTFEKINVEGTLNTVIAAEETGVNKFIHLSALGATNEPSYRYIYSKWLGEKSVCQSSLKWTILRPSIVYGEGFCFFDRLEQALKLFPPPFVPIPGGGNTLFQPVAVEDLVRCILTLLENEDMNGGYIYEIGGPEHLTYSDMVDELLNAKGLKGIKLNIPRLLMNFIVPSMVKLFKDPPVTPDELKQLEIDNITDKDAVERNFGFNPKELRQGLKYLAPVKKK